VSRRRPTVNFTPKLRTKRARRVGVFGQIRIQSNRAGFEENKEKNARHAEGIKINADARLF